VNWPIYAADCGVETALLIGKGTTRNSSGSSIFGIRIGVCGCSTATAWMLSVAVKTIAMAANSLRAVWWNNGIGRPHSLHLSMFSCPAVVCAKGHSALDVRYRHKADIAIALSRCPLLGVKRTSARFQHSLIPMP
jgi:hypothetical protein